MSFPSWGAQGLEACHTAALRTCIPLRMTKLLRQWWFGVNLSFRIKFRIVKSKDCNKALFCLEIYIRITVLNTGVRVPLRGTGEETDFPGRPRVSVSHLITCIKFSLIVLKIKLHTKKKKLKTLKMFILCHQKQFLSSQIKYENYGPSLGGNLQLNRAVFKIFLKWPSFLKKSGY